MNNILKIESNFKLSSDDVLGLQKLIEDKLNLKITEVKQVISDKIYGGVLINIGEYRFIISTENVSGLEKSDTFIIESNRELSNDEKTSLEDFAHKKFEASTNKIPKYYLNKNIISGTRIRFRDEEIDLTLNKILDKVFSKI